jgi:hypothetical protein
MEISVLLVLFTCVIAFVVLLVAVLAPKRTCPECSHMLSRFRRPRSLMQALWGGWTCPECSTHVSRTGQKVVAP